MINLFRCIPLLLLLWTTLLQAGGQAGPITSEALRLGTLNIAHGRLAAMNQLLVGGKQIDRNLEAIGGYLASLELHALALQEIDAPSRWSGRLDQPALLARYGGFEHYFFGSHAQSFLYDYGTALLSSAPLGSTYSHRFAASPPTPHKGFVFGTLRWNPGARLPQPVEIGLVSLHLDFSRQSVRRAQLQELLAFLDTVDMPVVLLGDFNLEAGTNDRELELLAAHLDLSLFQPDAPDQDTYAGRGGARLDWILLPPSLRFIRHHTDSRVLSDHKLVWADVALAETPPPAVSTSTEQGASQ